MCLITGGLSALLGTTLFTVGVGVAAQTARQSSKAQKAQAEAIKKLPQIATMMMS